MNANSDQHNGCVWKFGVAAAGKKDRKIGCEGDLSLTSRGFAPPHEKLLEGLAAKGDGRLRPHSDAEFLVLASPPRFGAIA